MNPNSKETNLLDIPQLNFSHSRHSSLEISTQKQNSSYFSSFKPPHAASSMDLQSLRQKQNIDISSLNLASHSFASKQQRNRAREKRLKNMRRYHSEKLLRQFTKELELVASNDYEGEDFEQRVQKLQGSLKMVVMMREAFENPQFHKEGENRIRTDGMEFGIGAMVEIYEGKLSKKEEEIRELRRKIEKLQVSRSLNFEKANERGIEDYECHQQLDQQNSTLRSNIRGYLQQSFGSISHKKSMENSRQSLRGIDIMPVMSNKYIIPPLSLRSMRESVRSSVDESIYVEDQFYVYNENTERDRVNCDGEEGEGEEERQVIVEELERIDENQEVNSKGYQTGRFAAEAFSPLKGNTSSGHKKPNPSFKFAIHQVQSLTILNQPPNKPNAMQTMTQTDPKILETKSIQTDFPITPTPIFQSHFVQNDVSNTQTESILSDASSDISNQMQIASNSLSILIQPLKKKKQLSQTPAFQVSLNSEYLGSRFKNHKTLIKMMVGLLSHLWRMTSKTLRFYQTAQQQSLLAQIKSKLNSFTDEFNTIYISSKPTHKYLPQQTYKKNIQELKSIQDLLTLLIDPKM